ncbi:MAG: O-antigen ligase family protein [Blastocatellia bacterium]|nr:O-antigen ligase family protein [Blastocatellia bacterium]
MKPKNNIPSKASGVSLHEILLLALPLLALVPNFFIIPDLAYEGLATQELVFAIAAAIFVIVGIWEMSRGGMAVARAELLLYGSLALFLVWQAVSLFWAPTAQSGFRLLGIWLGFGIFMIAGARKLGQRSAEWLHGVLTLITAILAWSLIYERLTYGEFMYGIFFSHGITSELLATLLPLQVLNYLCSAKRGSAMISFAVSLATLLALMIGLRRGAIAGAAAVLVAIGLAVAFKQIQVHNKQRLAILLGLFLLGAGVLGVRYREAVIFRIQGATQLSAAEGGLRTRLRGWITAWEMGKRNALKGVGNAGYPSLYGEYRKYFASNPAYQGIPTNEEGEYFNEIRSPLVHNEYLEIFVELGLIGVALFCLFWFLVVRQFWRHRKSWWAFGALLSLLAFGISSMTSAFSIRYTPGAMILACVLGLGLSQARDEAAESSATTIPKGAALACGAAVLVVCLIVTGRSYNVYASQLLQGQPYVSAPKLDFNYFPNNPAGNESLLRRYQQVLQLDPANAGAHLGYGLLLFQMKQPEKAVPEIEYALRNAYGRPFTHVLLAFALEQAGDLSRASRVLDDCSQSFPQTIYVRAAHAEILRKLGRIEQMEAEQKVMYSLNEVEARSWELALRMKTGEVMEEAKRRKLLTPDKLEPRFAGALIGVRAQHYLQ